MAATVPHSAQTDLLGREIVTLRAANYQLKQATKICTRTLGGLYNAKRETLFIASAISCSISS
jgi:hypothetical protein